MHHTMRGEVAGSTIICRMWPSRCNSMVPFQLPNPDQALVNGRLRLSWNPTPYEACAQLEHYRNGLVPSEASPAELLAAQRHALWRASLVQRCRLHRCRLAGSDVGKEHGRAWRRSVVRKTLSHKSLNSRIFPRSPPPRSSPAQYPSPLSPIAHRMFSARQIFSQVQRRGFAASARQVCSAHEAIAFARPPPLLRATAVVNWDCAADRLCCRPPRSPFWALLAASASLCRCS